MPKVLKRDSDPLSNSLKNHYTPPSKQTGRLKFASFRTPLPSILRKGQGAHVTSMHLILLGLDRILSEVSNNEINELFELNNRNSLRDRRSKLYDYVSSIGALDLTRIEILYREVDKILVKYNESRIKKMVIRQSTTDLHNDVSAVGESYQQGLNNIKSQFKGNGEVLREAFVEISKILTTFYNRIPDTTFHKIEGFNEEGSSASATSNSMDRVLEFLTQNKGVIFDDATIAIKNKDIAKTIKSLIDYREITEQTELQEHINYNLKENNNRKKGTPWNNPRNNNQDTLVKILAKHLHIFFAVYPEVKNNFDKNNELSNQFIRIFIGRGTSDLNWPKFNNDKDLKLIQENVKNEMAILLRNADQNNYVKWKNLRKAEGQDLDSSDDEEISVKVKIKSEPVKSELSSNSKIKPEITEAEIELMRKKMEELELLKKIISENKSSIPKHVIELLEAVSVSTKLQPKNIEPAITPKKDKTSNSLDEFNRVTETSNLTHQNVLFLIGRAFQNSGQNSLNHGCVAISEADTSLDCNLRDEILKFIGQESEKVSIALCRGELNGNGEVVGDTHWTALHLRKTKNADGSISIHSYHMDSLSQELPKSVERVLKSIKEVTLDELGEYLVENEIYKNAIAKLPNLKISNPLASKNQRSKQSDGHSCGYHTVFNMIRMNNASFNDNSWSCKSGVVQGERQNINIQEFIQMNRPILEQNFNAKTINNEHNTNPSLSVRASASSTSRLVEKNQTLKHSK